MFSRFFHEVQGSNFSCSSGKNFLWSFEGNFHGVLGKIFHYILERKFPNNPEETSLQFWGTSFLETF